MAKKTVKRAPTTRSKKATRRSGSTRVRTGGTSAAFGRFGLPLVLCAVLLGFLGIIGALFYSSATESSFFKLASVDVRGNERTSVEDIRRIVTSDVERSGVWNADMAELRGKIEKFPFVKSASVSRQLPSGIRIDIVERKPAAIVKLKTGDFLIDNDGGILAPAAKKEENLPFVLVGWDEGKTEKAPAENQMRLKIYKKMIEEWKQFDLAARVKQVDLTNLGEPSAIVEDSGRSFGIVVAKDNLGKSLKTALEAVAGKGDKIKSVNAGGVYPVINFLEF